MRQRRKDDRKRHAVFPNEQRKLNERGQRRKKSEHVEKEKVGRIRKD